MIIHYLQKQKNLLVLLFPFLLLTSCKNNESNSEIDFKEDYLEQIGEPEGKNIIETLKKENSLGHFSQLLESNDFPEFLDQNQKFTVFAPVNEVFPLLNEISEKDDNSNFEDEIVLNYIIKGSFSIEELHEIAARDSFSFLNSISDEKIYLNLDGKKLSLKGSSGQTAEIIQTLESSNGIIYILNNNLWPIQPLK